MERFGNLVSIFKNLKGAVKKILHQQEGRYQNRIEYPSLIIFLFPCKNIQKWDASRLENPSCIPWNTQYKWASFKSPFFQSIGSSILATWKYSAHMMIKTSCNKFSINKHSFNLIWHYLHVATSCKLFAKSKTVYLEIPLQILKKYLSA